MTKGGFALPPTRWKWVAMVSLIGIVALITFSPAQGHGYFSDGNEICNDTLEGDNWGSERYIAGESPHVIDCTNGEETKRVVFFPENGTVIHP